MDDYFENKENFHDADTSGKKVKTGHIQSFKKINKTNGTIEEYPLKKAYSKKIGHVQE